MIEIAFELMFEWDQFKKFSVVKLSLSEEEKAGLYVLFK